MNRRCQNITNLKRKSKLGLGGLALIVVVVVVIAVIAGTAAVLLKTSRATWVPISTTISGSSCITIPASSAQPSSIIISLLNAYTALTWVFQGAVNGSAYNFTASYNVVLVNLTTYQVNILELTSNRSISATIWFLKDGTVAALDIDGSSFSGTLAGYYFQTYFSLWENTIEYAQLIVASTSSSSFLHSKGTSTITLGRSEFAVTNYTADSLPETIQGCNGESVTLNSGSIFSVGAPTGSTYQLVTYLTAAGSDVTIGPSGQQQMMTFNVTSWITSASVTGK